MSSNRTEVSNDITLTNNVLFSPIQGNVNLSDTEQNDIASINEQYEEGAKNNIVIPENERHLQAWKNHINTLIVQLGNEQKQHRKSCFSFLYYYEDKGKDKKVNFLKMLSNLTSLDALKKAATYKCHKSYPLTTNNNGNWDWRAIRSGINSRTRDLLDYIAKGKTPKAYQAHINRQGNIDILTKQNIWR